MTDVIEAAARRIFDAMVHDDILGSQRPEWVDGAYTPRQEEARRLARAALKDDRPAPTGMARTIEQYRDGKPEAILAGSQAQALYALIDARHDILLLWETLQGMTADPYAEIRERRARARNGGAAPAAPPPQPDSVGAIVPDGCTGSALAMNPGVLHVNTGGSGYIAINESDFELEDDRCEGPDGPEGSVHWIARFDASEMSALRDFLNGATSPQPLPRVRHRKRGSTYEVLGVGRIQSVAWLWKCGDDGDDGGPSPLFERVDMLEVSIYRAEEDGSLWVRPREEFEDGRFAPVEGDR